MKKIYITLLGLLTWGAVAAQPFKGDVTIICNAVEERGEVLYLDLDIHVNRLAMNKCQSWTIIPELAATPQDVKMFPAVLINGNNKRQIYERKRKYNSLLWQSRIPYQLVNVKKETDTVLRYVMEVPYEYWMDDASLIVRQILTSCAEGQQLFTVNVAKQVTLEPRIPYAVNPQVALIEPERELVKNRNIQAQAYLDFPVGRSIIVPDFRRNPEELGKIRETLDGVRNDPDVRITGMFIEGYASPEGSYALNTRLSTERAQALLNYVGDNFGIDKNIIRAAATPEDWDGLRILVEDSNIANREEILAIIDSDLDPDVKEARIKRFPSYRTMLNEMFPQLRRSDYRVDFTVKDYTVAEAAIVLDRDPSLLSHYELFALANTYEMGSPEFDRVYDVIFRQYPDDEISNINMATVMYMRGEYTGAKRRLEGITGNAEALNTMGAILLIEGDTEGAQSYFERARSLGSPNAEHNLGEVQLKRADDEKMERYRNR
ncbi:MAG: DUF3868 domain-containing protein [Rikenellaceae bacterium]|nr:DUF3868 domain-containing protein [Rikenellaceae bacterium]